MLHQATTHKEDLKNQATTHKVELRNLQTTMREEAVESQKKINSIQSLCNSATISLLHVKYGFNVRGALEYVRYCLSRGDLSTEHPRFKFNDPVDKILKNFEKSEHSKEFSELLHYNHLRPNDTFRCLSGLYHAASKHAHGHSLDYLVISSTQWSSNEVFCLGFLFKKFEIPFQYCNAEGEFISFPFALDKNSPPFKPSSDITLSKKISQ